MIILGQILFLVITYFIAAIPFGLLFSLVFAKIDIRQHGSKNIGATNVFRVLGKKLGILTLICDALKGGIMVILGRFLFAQTSYLHPFLVVVGMVAILAHIFPIYLRFKGGKGVATALAVVIALDLPVGLLAILFWILTFAIFRISALSSLVAVFSTTISCWFLDSALSQIIFCWLLFVLVLFRHKDNISRILKGEELRLSKSDQK